MSKNDTPIERLDFGVRKEWFAGIPSSWPRSSMETTTVEQLEEEARIQAKNEEDDRLARFSGENVDAGSSAADAEPRVLDFFNGKTYAEGEKAYADHLASKGRK